MWASYYSIFNRVFPSLCSVVCNMVYLPESTVFHSLILQAIAATCLPLSSLRPGNRETIRLRQAGLGPEPSPDALAPSGTFQLSSPGRSLKRGDSHTWT